MLKEVKYELLKIMPKVLKLTFEIVKTKALIYSCYECFIKYTAVLIKCTVNFTVLIKCTVHHILNILV